VKNVGWMYLGSVSFIDVKIVGSMYLAGVSFTNHPLSEVIRGRLPRRWHRLGLASAQPPRRVPAGQEILNAHSGPSVAS